MYVEWPLPSSLNARTHTKKRCTNIYIVDKGERAACVRTCVSAAYTLACAGDVDLTATTAPHQQHPRGRCPLPSLLCAACFASRKTASADWSAAKQVVERVAQTWTRTPTDDDDDDVNFIVFIIM